MGWNSSGVGLFSGIGMDSCTEVQLRTGLTDAYNTDVPEYDPDTHQRIPRIVDPDREKVTWTDLDRIITGE